MFALFVVFVPLFFSNATNRRETTKTIQPPTGWKPPIPPTAYHPITDWLKAFVILVLPSLLALAPIRCETCFGFVILVLPSLPAPVVYLRTIDPVAEGHTAKVTTEV